MKNEINTEDQAVNIIQIAYALLFYDSFAPDTVQIRCVLVQSGSNWQVVFDQKKEILGGIPQLCCYMRDVKIGSLFLYFY